MIRIIIYWGLYWGRPILGNYHFQNMKSSQFGIGFHIVAAVCPALLLLPKGPRRYNVLIPEAPKSLYEKLLWP